MSKTDDHKESSPAGDVPAVSSVDPGHPEKKRLSLQKILEGLRHPIVLLLLSSAIIPLAVYSINSRKTLMDSRQKKALEIVEKNAAFEGELYSLFVDLGLFHQANQAEGSAPGKPNEELKKRQSEFAKTFGGRYAQFSRSYSDQHLWVEELYVHGIILQLFSSDDVRRLKAANGTQTSNNVPVNLLKLRAHVEAYKENFLESIGVLGDYQKILLDKDYNPNDSSISNRIVGDEITGAYNKLTRERALIVESLVQDFTP